MKPLDCGPSLTRRISRLAGLACLSLVGITAYASELVWANNASLGNPHIQAYDLGTGNLVVDFAAPNKDAQNGKANGRGIAVVGTTIYYSLANTGKVYMTDAVTHADKGVAFSTPLVGISALSWDGTGLWLSEYVFIDQNIPSTLNIYKYSVTGALLKTLPLPLSPLFSGQQLLPRDGLAVTPTGFVTDPNSSVPYASYDLNGNFLNEDFITSSFVVRGIAFDGTNYITPNSFPGGPDHLLMFDANGVFVKSVLIPSAAIPFALEGVAAVKSSPQLGEVFLTPTTVLGGDSVAGKVSIGPAATQPVTIRLTSSNGLVASLETGSTVTIPAGENTASFRVSTTPVATPTPVAISASFAGGVQTASINVVPAPMLASLSVSPTSVLGANGNASLGTVTLSNAAAQATTVTLTSSNPALVTVPFPGVSVPAGSGSVTFQAVILQFVPTDTTVTITAILGSNTHTALLHVLASTPTDVVNITQAQYDFRKGNLNVQATGSSAMTNMKVYVTSTGQLIGPLANGGGGTYKMQFPNVFPNPQNITVKSSLGGSATSEVMAK